MTRSYRYRIGVILSLMIMDVGALGLRDSSLLADDRLSRYHDLAFSISRHIEFDLLVGR